MSPLKLTRQPVPRVAPWMQLFKNKGFGVCDCGLKSGDKGAKSWNCGGFGRG